METRSRSNGSSRSVAQSVPRSRRQIYQHSSASQQSLQSSKSASESVNSSVKLNQASHAFQVRTGSASCFSALQLSVTGHDHENEGANIETLKRNQEFLKPQKPSLNRRKGSLKISHPQLFDHPSESTAVKLECLERVMEAFIPLHERNAIIEMTKENSNTQHKSIPLVGDRSNQADKGPHHSNHFHSSDRMSFFSRVRKAMASPNDSHLRSLPYQSRKDNTILLGTPISHLKPDLMLEKEVLGLPCMIPTLCATTCEEIERRCKGPKINGLFVNPGEPSRIQALVSVFESPPDYGNFHDLTIESIHNVTSVLLVYLKSLPEPLFDLRLWRVLLFASTHSSKSPVRRITAAQLIVSLLPTCNRALFIVLLNLLHQGPNFPHNSQSHVTLAHVFADSIFSPRKNRVKMTRISPSSPEKAYHSPNDNLTSNKKSVEALVWLLQFWPAISQGSIEDTFRIITHGNIMSESFAVDPVRIKDERTSLEKDVSIAGIWGKSLTRPRNTVPAKPRSRSVTGTNPNRATYHYLRPSAIQIFTKQRQNADSVYQLNSKKSSSQLSVDQCSVQHTGGYLSTAHPSYSRSSIHEPSPSLPFMEPGSPRSVAESLHRALTDSGMCIMAADSRKEATVKKPSIVVPAVPDAQSLLQIPSAHPALPGVNTALHSKFRTSAQTTSIALEPDDRGEGHQLTFNQVRALPKIDFESRIQRWLSSSISDSSLQKLSPGEAQKAYALQTGIPDIDIDLTDIRGVPSIPPTEDVTIVHSETEVEINHQDLSAPLLARKSTSEYDFSQASIWARKGSFAPISANAAKFRQKMGMRRASSVSKKGNTLTGQNTFQDIAQTVRRLSSERRPSAPRAESRPMKDEYNALGTTESGATRPAPVSSTILREHLSTTPASQTVRSSPTLPVSVALNEHTPQTLAPDTPKCSTVDNAGLFRTEYNVTMTVPESARPRPIRTSMSALIANYAHPYDVSPTQVAIDVPHCPHCAEQILLARELTERVAKLEKTLDDVRRRIDRQ